MNRRIAIRNAVQRRESDKEFVELVVSDDQKTNTVREAWLRDFTRDNEAKGMAVMAFYCGKVTR